MPASLARTLGFLIPTLVVVVGQHVAAEPTAGEALDGAVSAAFFATLFFAGSLAAHAMRRLPRPPLRRPALIEWSTGLLAGVLAWGLLWLFWAVPPTQAMRGATGIVFVFNCLWVLTVGVLAQPRRRQPPLLPV